LSNLNLSEKSHSIINLNLDLQPKYVIILIIFLKGQAQFLTIIKSYDFHDDILI